MSRRISQELVSGAVASISGGGGGGNLNDLDDVNAGSPSDDDSLTYDSASGKWVPQAISGGAGGGDWTNVILGTTLDVTSITPADSDLAFTPAANKTYEIRVIALCRTESAGVGPRAGVKWPTAGVVDGIVMHTAASSQSVTQTGYWPAGTDGNTLIGGAANTTDSHPQIFQGLLITTTGITGDFIVTLRGENATAEVHLMAGSILSYREVA